ncbi:MAG: hypothetical protein ACREPU_00640 [Rhodanobacteraceae bacterium]
MEIKATLSATLPSELVEALIAALDEIHSNFVHRKWKASELDAGHLVEAVRRIIEFRLFGTYTPIGKLLPIFNDKLLLQYEHACGDESYRILIPRVLRAIYGVRNKRGVGHLGLISPNEMDATLILYNAKWVIAEILRLESGLPPAETQSAIERIVEREALLLWKVGAVVRVSRKGIPARNQILLLLYDKSPQTAHNLREQCEYGNPSNFRKILKRLHSDKLIFLTTEGSCVLMPGGVFAAQNVVPGA